MVILRAKSLPKLTSINFHQQNFFALYFYVTCQILFMTSLPLPTDRQACDMDGGPHSCNKSSTTSYNKSYRNELLDPLPATLSRRRSLRCSFFFDPPSPFYKASGSEEGRQEGRSLIHEVSAVCRGHVYLTRFWVGVGARE